ncbi:MAG: InlB B-repeat-containing protein [Clostridia bacterium]|nr:InlB B-repeat-containing protein [Clostridia bacterium]
MKKILFIFIICLTAISLLACAPRVESQPESESRVESESKTESVLVSESESERESESISESISESASESEYTSESISESASESNSESEEQKFALITFDSNGGSAVESVTVEIGSKITKPQNPVKSAIDGEYEFLGWYYNGEAWDFENGVATQNMVLVAKWKLVEGYTKPFVPKD